MLAFVGPPGLEPGTPWLWVRCSNQLSYGPVPNPNSNSGSAKIINFLIFKPLYLLGWRRVRNFDLVEIRQVINLKLNRDICWFEIEWARNEQDLYEYLLENGVNNHHCNIWICTLHLVFKLSIMIKTSVLNSGFSTFIITFIIELRLRQSCSPTETNNCQWP